MNRFVLRSVAIRKMFVKIETLTVVVIYSLFSLNLPDFKSAFHIIDPDAGTFESSQSTTVQVEAIPVPAGASTRDQNHNHNCCCKHIGNKCEMGCCDRADILRDGASIHDCKGNGPDQSHYASAKLGEHIFAISQYLDLVQSSGPIFEKPMARPDSFPSKPPEKVPIT